MGKNLRFHSSFGFEMDQQQTTNTRDVVCADPPTEADLGSVPPCMTSCSKCCATSPGLRVCGGCRVVRYCSETCQRAAWGEHKAPCAAAARQREEQRQMAYRASTQDTLSKMSPEERKWKSWLGAHGEDVHVDSSNLHQYLPDVPTPDTSVSITCRDRVPVNTTLLPTSLHQLTAQPPSITHWDSVCDALCPRYLISGPHPAWPRRAL